MVCDVYRARRTAINDAQRRNDLLLYLPQSYLYFVKEKKKKKRAAGRFVRHLPIPHFFPHNKKDDRDSLRVGESSCYLVVRIIEKRL